MSDKVSVIVPVYNVEPYLNKCINSILCQTYKNIEIILVNDGSTDKSGMKCEQYKKTDARIKVIHKKNGGLSSARNAGLKHAAGRYITFVDSDDYIDVDMVESLYLNCKNYSCQMAICQFHVVGGNIAETGKKLDEVRLYSPVKALEELIAGNIESYAWNKLYERSLFGEIIFPEGKNYEDIYIMHRLFLKCKRIVEIPNRAYYYFQRKGSIMHQWSIKNSLDNYWALRTRLADLEGIGQLDLSNLYADIIKQLLYMEITKGKVSFLERRKKHKEIGLIYKDFRSIQIQEKNVVCHLTANEQLKYMIYKKSKFFYRILVGWAYEGFPRKYADYIITKLRNKVNICIKRSNKQTIWFIGLPEYNNLGDCAIGYATIKFLKQECKGKKLRLISERKYIANAREIHRNILKEDIIVLQGGGNISDLYKDQQYIRRKVMAGCKHNKIIIFPQTVYFTHTKKGYREMVKTKKQFNKCKNLTLAVREEYSYKFVKENFDDASVILLPDIVFSLKYSKKNIRENKILICIRNDKEASFGQEMSLLIKQELLKSGNRIFYTETITDTNTFINEYEDAVENKLEEISTAKLLVTDRLHGVIFAAITGTPCIALDNFNYKIKGICQWLKDLNYIVYVNDMEQFSKALTNLVKTEPNTEALDLIRMKLTALVHAVNGKD